MRIAYMSFLCGLCVLGSCNLEEKSKSVIKQWYYEDGTLKKEQEYNSDNLEHGLYRFYYPSGILKDSAQISFNKLHGNRYLYYENGAIHKISNYCNDKLRSGITFRQDGTIKLYRAYNYYEELMYIIWYDDKGIPIKHDGNLIYSWVQEDYYTIGSKFAIELLVAKPPFCIASISIYDWDPVDKTLGNKKEFSPDEFNRVTYSCRQNSIRDIYILHVATIHDTLANNSLSDTLLIGIAKDGKSSHTRKTGFH